MTDHFARPDASASSGEPPHDYVPDLDGARQIARRILDVYQGTRPDDHGAVTEAFAATSAALSTLLDALDGELPR